MEITHTKNDFVLISSHAEFLRANQCRKVYILDMFEIMLSKLFFFSKDVYIFFIDVRFIVCPFRVSIIEDSYFYKSVNDFLRTCISRCKQIYILCIHLARLVNKL